MPDASAIEDAVHPLVRKATAWCWRLLVIFAALCALIWLVAQLQLIVVPVALALMLTSLALPAVDFLNRRGLPRGLAVAVVLLSGIALLGALLTFVVSQFVNGVPGLVDQVAHSIDTLKRWLVEGPAHLSSDQINHAGDTVVQALRNNQEKLTSGALSTATTASEIIAGALLVVFTLIFFLLGGRAIWEFVTKIFPRESRERVRAAGRAGFHSLTGYVRATALVAFVDAVGIGTGLAILGVPLALPLASLVFLGAFIPLVGAVVTGFLAVLVALIAKGAISALITLGVVIAVQQLEAHVLQPLVMGRAVSIHPLAVVLAIAAGGFLAGILGALLAVPLLAVVNSAVRVLLAEDPAAEDEVQASSRGPVIEATADKSTADEPADDTAAPKPG